MSKVYRHSDGSYRDYPEVNHMISSNPLTIQPGVNYDVIIPNATIETNPKHLEEEMYDAYYTKQEVIDGETAKENTNKGIRYNKGKLRWRNFPMFLMEPLVKVGSANEKHEGNPNGKYTTHNFLNGLKVSDTLDSLHRHLCDFTDPSKPDIDPEDNVHHLAKIAWNALVALYYIENKPEWDDRTLKHGKD